MWLLQPEDKALQTTAAAALDRWRCQRQAAGDVTREGGLHQ